jgi:hypothetical protein
MTQRSAESGNGRSGRNYRLPVLLLSLVVGIMMFLAPQPADAAGTVWTQILRTTYSLPTPRNGHCSLIFNNVIWIFGGYGSTPSLLNDVWYSGSGYTWNQATASAAWPARRNAGCAVFNGKMYLIGGDDNSGSINQVWSSANGSSWVQESTPSLTGVRYRCNPGVVVFNNKLWIMGGFEKLPINACQNDVWSSADGNNWVQESTTNIWPSREAHGAVVFNNKIYVIGGRKGVTNYNDVWSSVDGKAWVLEKSNAFPFGRYGHTTTVFDNKIWVVGGQNLNEVWYWDGASANWTIVTPTTTLPTELSYHSAVVFKNKLWLLGGTINNDLWLTNSDLWNP